MKTTHPVKTGSIAPFIQSVETALRVGEAIWKVRCIGSPISFDHTRRRAQCSSNGWVRIDGNEISGPTSIQTRCCGTAYAQPIAATGSVPSADIRCGRHDDGAGFDRGDAAEDDRQTPNVVTRAR